MLDHLDFFQLPLCNSLPGCVKHSFSHGFPMVFPAINLHLKFTPGFFPIFTMDFPPKTHRFTRKNHHPVTTHRAHRDRSASDDLSWSWFFSACSAAASMSLLRRQSIGAGAPKSVSAVNLYKSIICIEYVENLI